MATICKVCGVELDEGMERCPLCQNIPGETKSIPGVHRKHSAIGLLIHKKNVWMALSVVALSSIAFIILINLIIDKSLSWSLYASGSVLAAWAFYSIHNFFKDRILLWISLGLMTTLGLLLLIDGLSNGFDWFYPIGLVIASVAYVFAGLFVFLIQHVKYQGFNVLGFALLHIVPLCLATELVIKGNIADLRWSLFVAISSIPISIILLFIHYKLKKGNDLKSFFHI